MKSVIITIIDWMLIVIMILTTAALLNNLNWELNGPAVQGYIRDAEMTTT